MDKARPWHGRHIHFIGIGGSGMSGLALVAHRLGATVSGTDQKDSFYIESLRRLGVKNITIGHSVDALPSHGEFVFTSAIHSQSAGYSEREAARKKGLKELHRSELLAEITRAHHTTVAVAGAHGKTTTTGMIAYILESAGKDPSYILGGLLLPPAAHARAGDSGILVIEADESDKSLLNYKVDVAVITSIDLDHVGDGGHYHTIEDVAEVFAQFSGEARKVFVDHVATDTLKKYIPAMDVVHPVAANGDGAFMIGGETYVTNQPGWHNVENAAVAATVATYLGCTPAQIREGLKSFPGVAGRFELKGQTARGAMVYDDYGHHPVEVTAAVRTGRSLAKGKVFAVFQPHLFSRTQQFISDFAQALSAADHAYVEPVYAAREDPAQWQHVSSEQIAQASNGKVSYASSRHKLAEELAAKAGPNDVVLLIGAGDVGEIAKQIVK